MCQVLLHLIQSLPFSDIDECISVVGSYLLSTSQERNKAGANYLTEVGCILALRHGSGVSCLVALADGVIYKQQGSQCHGNTGPNKIEEHYRQ